MKLPPVLHNQIVEFFTSIPPIHDCNQRQSLIYSAGLDQQLQDQIDFYGSPGQFFQMLVSTLMRYGTLEDGRNALEAVLETTKRYVGQDRQHYCDRLIQELRTSVETLEATMKRGLTFEKIIDEKFLQSLQHCDEISSIDIIAHTGRHIVRGLCDHIRDNCDLRAKLKDIDIRILLRNPAIETKRRKRLILDVLQNEIQYLHHIGFTHVHVHFYQNLPTFRGIVCNRQEPRIAYLSFYYFPLNPPLNSISQRSPYAFVIDEGQTGESPLIDLVNSWFEHFWGKNKEEIQEIHSVIFDFDDTIVNSHDIQIQAWVDTIKAFQQELAREHFQETVWKTLHNETLLRKEVAAVFFEEQHAESIFKRLFNEETLAPEKVTEIRERRFDIRESSIKHAGLFDGCAKVLQDLAGRYHLIIISATDEDMITEYLTEQTVEDRCTKQRTNLLGYFLYAFGKGEPTFEWKLERKSQLILKVINVLGVPVERLVYVGDNNNDFEACQEIGIDFIEARLFREDSLIHSHEQREYFTHWKEFPEKLERIEQQKRTRLRNMLSKRKKRQ